ncbi:MAG: hypothetical protein R3288_10750 [Woeseiaceae bacterium]|nr:hypothetical protein [Woeseiaceae bacterium]
MRAAAPDVFTSFEFNASGGFDVGSAPYGANFSNGNAESRGIPQFYISGLNAWHILTGTSATVTFDTNPNALTFHVRTENAADVATVNILDDTGATIQTVVPTNAFQMISITRAAGQSLIGSVVVTSTSGGDVVIDDLTFGYDGNGFAGATDDFGCAISSALEFVCLVTDSTTDALIAGLTGTLQVSANGDVTGTGTIYAPPGETLPDGDTLAPLTIGSGTATTDTSLDFVLDAAGTRNTITTVFDTEFNRGSSLATVEGTYTMFDIFGDPSSFVIDAAGAISAQSNSGCVGAGQVTIIDAADNVYDVNLDLSSCGALNGTYDGLGITGDENAMNDEFVFGVFNAQGMVIGDAIK